jgi:tetratricopeptide (TPR) repeat protein
MLPEKKSLFIVRKDQPLSYRITRGINHSMMIIRGRKSVVPSELPCPTPKLIRRLPFLHVGTLVAIILTLLGNSGPAADSLDTEWKKYLRMAEEAENSQSIAQTLSLYERALSLAEQFGKQDGRLSVTLHRFGKFCSLHNMSDKAIDLLRESTSVIEHLPADQRLDLDLAKEYTWLGFALLHKHKYAEAESYARKALALQEGLLDPDDEALMETLPNLAALLFVEKHYVEALSCYRRAAHVARVQNSPELGPMLLMVARLEVMTDQLDEADKTFQQAMACKRRSNKQEFADGLHGLGRTNANKQRWRQAEFCFKEAQALLCDCGLTNGPMMAELLDDYGTLYKLRGQFPAAEGLYRRAFAILKLPKEPAQIKLKGKIAEDLALTLEAEGKSKEAAALKKESESLAHLCGEVPKSPEVRRPQSAP